jgi:DNA-binding PadR family transcriptional regulator
MGKISGMNRLPMLSGKEQLIIQLLLASASRELYGLELVRKSRGKLKRGTVYVTLARMADKGLVTSREVRDEGQAGLPRRVFQVTGVGQRAFEAWELAHSVFMGQHA